MNKYENYLRLGTLSNRHMMPVDVYVLEGEIPPGRAYLALFNATLEMAHQGIFRGYDGVLLYYSGLTIATYGVTDALDYLGIKSVLMSYDHKHGVYRPVERRNRREAETPP
jgi:hypothetical protein